MRLLIAAVAITLALLGLRLEAARAVGLSDIEALFLAYGLHPQPAYVDYPGLIGGLARLLPPDPSVVHLSTTLAAGALPWAGVLAAWAIGAPARLALRTYFPLALLPPPRPVAAGVRTRGAGSAANTGSGATSAADLRKRRHFLSVRAKNACDPGVSADPSIRWPRDFNA